jgi:hypothetical protein
MLAWVAIVSRYSFRNSPPNRFIEYPHLLAFPLVGARPSINPLESTLVEMLILAPFKLFKINTYRSVHSKGLYLPLESTLMKNRGVGVQLLLLLTRIQNGFSSLLLRQEKECWKQNYSLAVLTVERG